MKRLVGVVALLAVFVFAPRRSASIEAMTEVVHDSVDVPDELSRIV